MNTELRRGRRQKPLELYEDYCGCWRVSSHKSRTGGYTLFTRNGKLWLIHRYMYEKYFGTIPKGMFVCHHCDHPGCVNPSHLFLGTQKDNIRDAIGKKRLVGFQKGHLLSAKLAKEQVLKIRSRNETPEYLAKIYGVKRHQIYRIKNREQWAWL